MSSAAVPLSAAREITAQFNPFVASLWPIFSQRFLNFPHVLLFRIPREFDPYLKGAYLLLSNERHPDRLGSKGAMLQLGWMIDGQVQQPLIRLAGRVEEVKTFVHDLAHQQARAMDRQVDDSSRERAGNDVAVPFVDDMHFKGEVIDKAGGSALLNVHLGLLFCRAAVIGMKKDTSRCMMASFKA